MSGGAIIAGGLTVPQDGVQLLAGGLTAFDTGLVVTGGLTTDVGIFIHESLVVTSGDVVVISNNHIMITSYHFINTISCLYHAR